MNGLVPQKWHEVFGKVLAKKPDDRYQTATEFVQDLEYCLGSWFGAAWATMTMAEPAPGRPPDAGSTAQTAILPAMPDEVTMAMPPLGRRRAAGRLVAAHAHRGAAAAGPARGRRAP